MKLNKFFRLRVQAMADEAEDLNGDEMLDFLDSELGGGDDGASDDDAGGDDSPADKDAGTQDGADSGQDDAGDAGDDKASDKAGTDDGADAAADEGADDDDKGGAGKQVPLATMLQERSDFQDQIRAMERKFGRFEGLQEQLNKFIQDKQAAADKGEDVKTPDYLDDPKAYIDHMFKEMTATMTKQNDKVVDINKNQEAMTQIQKVTGALTSFDNSFAETNPDYYDALEHVRKVNIDNALDMGADQATAEKQAAQAMFQTQVGAMRSRVNPAEYMYKIAKRFGYVKAADDTGDDKGDDKGADDKSDKKPEDDLEALIKGQEAGSLGNGGSVDIEELADAEPDEFTAIMEGVFGKGAGR